MPLATTFGKEHALRALAERRAKNRDRQPIDNSSLYAGSPMYFGCIACNAVIAVPESYITRPTLCCECEAMNELGWLE
jgi:hypothetical protein